MLKDLTIDRLDRGSNPLAAPGQLGVSQQGPFWRKLINMVPRDGSLSRREGTVALTDQPTFDDTRDRCVLLWAELPVGPEAGSRYLLVTSREVMIGDFSSWTDVTPIHTVGTVSITNGTAALTGIGTTWQALAITPGQIVELPAASGDWYEIATVASDTSITLTTNFTGTTIVGGNYVIRRQWNVPLSHVFHAVLNGDVYIAGGVSQGYLLGFGTLIPDGGVIKITGAAVPLHGAFDPADSVYLVSGERAPEAGVDFLGYNFTPYGLTILPDGRLMMPIHWSDISVPEGAGNRIVYSDHLDVSLWTSGSSGFSDITDLPGEISGLSNLGRDYLVHLGGAGIEYVEFQGEDDFPIRLYQSTSDSGAIGPKAQVTAQGTVYFVGNDLNLRMSSGQGSEIVYPAFRFHLVNQIAADNIDKQQIALGHMRYDPYREELCFLFEPDTSDETTREMRLSLQTGDLSVHEYGRRIRASAMLVKGTGDFYSAILPQERETEGAILGTFLKLGGVDADMLYVTSEEATSDALAIQAARVPQAETDDLAFGDLVGYKVLPDIVLSYIAAASGTIQCVVLRDGAVSETLSVSIASTAGHEKQVIIRGDEGRSARLYRLRFQPASGDTFVPKLTKLQLWYDNVGDVRAV